jgi:hypothetical protein
LPPFVAWLLGCLLVGGLGLHIYVMEMLFVDDFCGLASNSIFDKMTQGNPPPLTLQTNL